MMQGQHVNQAPELKLSQETCNSTRACKSLILLPNAAPPWQKKKKKRQLLDASLFYLESQNADMSVILKHCSYHHDQLEKNL